MATNQQMSAELTLGEAAGKYLSSSKEFDRAPAQSELNRFVRHFGSDILISKLRAMDIEDYQDKVEKTGADVTRRLEPLKHFLVFLHKQGGTEINYGKYIKSRRTTVNKAGTRRASRDDDETIQMTGEGFENLKKEFEYLTTTKREEIRRELLEARVDKDFRENAPYDAAKSHQAEVEIRIRQIERQLATAQVIDQRRNQGDHVAIGSTVLLRDLTHGEELTYTLVGTNEANPRAGRISIASPVGRAMLDRHVGDEIEVSAPIGAIRYQIDRIMP